MGIERAFRSRKFDRRCDQSALRLMLRCVHLTVLAIRERISTATRVLIGLVASTRMARDGQRRYLSVRRNALLKRINWTISDVKHLSDDLSIEIDYDWLKTIATSYENTMEHMEKLMRSNAVIIDDNRYYFTWKRYR